MLAGCLQTGHDILSSRPDGCLQGIASGRLLLSTLFGISEQFCTF